MTLISPPVPSELTTRCQAKIADPLTTGDQLDVARALGQSISAYRDCKARHDALVDAVQSRDAIVQSIQTQLQK